MRPTDARCLDHQTLTILRKRGVQSVQEGQSPEVGALALGIHRGTIDGWLATSRQGGWDAVDARKRGGRPPTLDANAMQWIYETVTLKNPLQLQFPFALWTARMVRGVIQRHLGVKLSKASVCRLLRQLGLTPHHPVWRASQQNPQAVEWWLTEEYPQIKTLAKRLKAQIFCGDEAGVRSDHHAGTTWALKGHTPLVSSTGARCGLTILSAVSAQGECRLMTVKGAVGTSRLIDFITRLLHGPERMIFLIVDRHPVHRSRKVARFIATEKIRKRFRLFFLPPSSPALNPDERVWNDLKNHAIGQQVIPAPDHLHGAIIRHLRLIQKTPARVRASFNNATTQDAV